MKLVETSVAAYLETLDAQLGDVPPARRAEIADETRIHLEAMIAARRADGMDANDAWQSARTAFGDADSIGRELAREWKRAPRVETVGTPLSTREKSLKIGRAFLFALLVGPTGLLLVSWLSPRNLLGIFFLILTPLLLLFNIYRDHKKRLPWTPAHVVGEIFCFAISISFALKIHFADQLRGTSLESALNSYPAHLIWIGGSVLLMLWADREEETTLPWRHTPRYAQSPVAAEEEHRMSSLLGTITGTTMGCIGLIWVGWQFFGIGLALWGCLAVIALNGVILRLIR